jgi:hypothetical protein
LLTIVKNRPGNPNETCRLVGIENEQFEHFSALEQQGTHAETDILRALSYLWRSD